MLDVASAELLVGQPVRILVAEDESTLRTVISRVLHQDGYDVTTVASGEEALAAFEHDSYPLVITDIVMGGLSGLDLLKELKRRDPDVHVVIMTSNASLDSAMTALRLGAYDYLTKPFDDLDILSSVVKRAIQNIQLSEENEYLLAALKVRTQELERLNRSLKEMADRDGLTGLHNHRFFREALTRELARASRHQHVFSLVLADIDHFKRFNDTHGHLAGDTVLKAVAQVLAAGAREEMVLARYGGEEFVFLLPETDRRGARVFAERVREAIACIPVSEVVHGADVALTMSFGLSAYPEDGAHANDLIERADRGLYEAKRGGRNRVSA